jgi:hypothetical protein
MDAAECLLAFKAGREVIPYRAFTTLSDLRLEHSANNLNQRGFPRE